MLINLKWIVVFATLLFSSSGAFAAPGMPMVTSPLLSGEDLSRRIETGNGLEAGADFVSAFQQVRPELQVSDKAGAAQVVRDLHPCQPTAGKYIVSRVKNGATGTRERHVSSSEAAFCDDSRNVVVLQKCGNVARPVERPVVVQPPVVQMVQQEEGWRKLIGVPLTPVSFAKPNEFDNTIEPCDQGTLCDGTLRFVDTAADLAGMYFLGKIRIGGARSSSSSSSSSSPATVAPSTPSPPIIGGPADPNPGQVVQGTGNGGWIDPNP